jgi:hypothetical protein
MVGDTEIVVRCTVGLRRDRSLSREETFQTTRRQALQQPRWRTRNILRSTFTNLSLHSPLILLPRHLLPERNGPSLACCNGFTRRDSLKTGSKLSKR